MANITAQDVIEQARAWIGYREKNHASANLTDFFDDAGDGNYTIFSVICGYGIQPWQWCQLFVCSVFALVCGGSIEDAKKILCDTDDNGVLTSYTPTGAQYFKNAGRWHTIPEPGDVVYFYGSVSSEEGRSRICHTGIVEWVDAGSETFGTIEGNSNFDGFTTNGGSVARHEYSYAEVGGSNRVNGFGRPNYDAVANVDDTILVEVDMKKVIFHPCKIGDSGTNVLLVQEILAARGLYPSDRLDGDFGTRTDDAVREYQRIRIAAGANIGGEDGEPDGVVGWATFNDLTALPPA